MKEPMRLDIKEAFWPDEHAGPFLLRLTYASLEDRVECVGVEVRSVRVPGDRRGSLITMRSSPGEGPGDDAPRPKGDYIVQPTPLSHELYDKLPDLEQIAGATAEQSKLYGQWFAKGPLVELRRRLQELQKQARRKPSRRGRPESSPYHYFRVAEQMLRHPSDPLPHIREWAQKEYADEYPDSSGRPDDSTLYRWMQKAAIKFPTLKEATR